MNRRQVSALALFGLLAAPAAMRAHEGHAHKAMGTVSAVRADKNEIEIKTTDAKTLVVTVSPATKFKKGDAAATLKDVEVGQRVVAVYQQKAQALQASEVMIGVAAGASQKP
jgi:hypothetical protein